MHFDWRENENETEAAPVEEEPKELTLDEWKAQRAGRLKPQYNIRKAGEGEDPSQWKKMYELNKKKDGEDEVRNSSIEHLRYNWKNIYRVSHLRWVGS